MKESSALRIIALISIILPTAVALIFWMPGKTELVNPNLRHLPLFHATLNGITFSLLLLAFYFIRKKNIAAHRASMLTASGLSAVFLISYVIYHSLVPESKFGGTGSIRTVYFTLLISHILLAAIIAPLVLISLYRGLTNNIAKHKRIARWTLPIWLYVAITGVIVYLFMAPYYPQ